MIPKQAVFLFFKASAQNMQIPLDNLKSSLRDRIDLLIKIGFGVAVAIGCYFVVAPFATAILISAMLCVVTWPFFIRVDSMLGHRGTLSAVLMVAFLAVIVLIPLTILVIFLAQQVSTTIILIRDWVAAGMPLPDWLSTLPWIGEYLHAPVGKILEYPEVTTALKQIATAASKGILTSTASIVNVIIQILLIAAIAFVFYRNGESLANKVQGILDKVGGNLSNAFSSILVNTTRSVVFGIFGTALGQALLAYIGFFICGIPNKTLLAFLVFILSMVPMGPPLVWVPVAIALYLKGDMGYAIFLALWGTFAVSSVDNFLKPMLISQGTPLPMALVFLGVFGGLLSFGFLGILLGPIFLSLGSALFTAWLAQPVRTDTNPSSTPPPERLSDESGTPPAKE